MKKTRLALSITVITCFCLCSCTNKNSIQNQVHLAIEENEMSSESIENRGSLNIVNGRTKNYQNNSGNNIDTFDQQNMSAEKRAEKIATAVQNMDSIKKAHAVVTGNTVIVGITLDNEISDSELKDLKKLVETKILSIDLGIKHVAITASPDIVEKIIDTVGGDEEIPEEEEKLEEFKENDIFFRAAPTI